MRVIVCGSRHWRDEAAIRRELEKLPADATVIHSGCKGADKIAGRIAKELGLSVRVFLADWKGRGDQAGPERNSRMLKVGQPDLVLAFTPDIETSKGTRNMVGKAIRAGVRVKVFSS